MESSTRHMRFLYYLTQSGGTVTAKELAEYAGVSERTVKTDLVTVRSVAAESGAALCSKKGKGYWLEILDKEQFETLRTQLNFQFSSYNYTQEYEDRANRVVRILLVQKDYLKLEEIAVRLFLSRSSLKGIMPDVRDILSAFKLTLSSRPGAGIKIEGAEINIRFCMLELFIDYDYRNVPKINDEEYLSYFELADVDIGELRQHFLKALRESGTRVADENTHRLVRYFYLMYNRFQEGKRLSFSSKDQRFLRKIGEYQTASEILEVLEQKDNHIVVDEAEIFGVELLLLMWNDLNESDDLAGRYPDFYRKSELLAEEIMAHVEDEWGINLDELTGIRQILISALIPNYTKIHFAYLGYNRTIGKKVENNMLSSSPVCVGMALMAARVIRERYGLVASKGDIFNYTVRFYIAIARIHYDYVPRRILISAQSGNQSCAIIRDKMIKRFGVEAFARLDTINAYEVRRLNQDDYDYMILNFAPYYYRYDLPVIYVDSVPDERQMNQIYYQVILGGYQLRDVQEKLGFQPDFIYENFIYEGRDSLIRLISYKYCAIHQVMEMEQLLQSYTDICVWNNVAAIVTGTRLTGGNRFELFCLETPGVWVKKTIKYILFISVDFKSERKALKYLEQVTHELICNPENLERLVKTKSMNQFYEIVKHGLTLGQ